MRRRTWLLLPLALAACASPPLALYTLAAQPGPVLHTSRRSVELRRIGLAGYLDRPEIVRTDAQYRLHVTDADRWGEPLGGMIARVMTENLVQRLPDAAVFTESGAISTQPDIVLEMDIQRLDADASGAVVLLAQVAVRREGARAASANATTLRVSEQVAGAATQETVAAMSRALAELCDRIAPMLAR
jgi:uncharacterized protein